MATVTPPTKGQEVELAARDNEARYLLHCIEAARARLYSLSCRCNTPPLVHLSEAELLWVRQEGQLLCQRLAEQLARPAPPPTPALPDLPAQP